MPGVLQAADYHPPQGGAAAAALGAVAALTRAIRACTVCAPHLPHAPRPVVRLHPAARILIAGQAPGARVHAVGAPFCDPSGDRLRAWMGVDAPLFYDLTKIAVAPAGFCFPGVTQAGADKPPRSECAPLWRAPVLAALTHVRLTLLVGGYSQKAHLGQEARRTVTETVAAWREYDPAVVPLPHPSWRNTAWLKKHPWFAAELLPVLRERVQTALR